MTSRWSLFVAAVAVGAGLSEGAGQSSAVDAIVTSPSARASYLARAVIWQDPGPISPADLLRGPSDRFPYTVAEATAPEGVACTFAGPGRPLGGKSSKFTCRAAGAHDLRLKYWDPDRQAGNRETFAMVAATRLMWALGFPAVPALPINIQCDGCPEDPMSGHGDRRRRRYVAMWQSTLPGPPILSREQIDQGWSWRELDEAISALPAGEERTRKRAQFGALTLLGVLMQHGDRKPEQHALYCADGLEPAAGEIRTAPADASRAMLFERPGASACGRPAVTLVDVGATFGGAGRTSNATTAKIHLESWRRKPIFRAASDGTCRGDLTVSLAAGGGSNPLISEEGRQFLLEQLHRLTPDHVRAIFTAAWVDRIDSARPTERPDPSSDPIEAWRTAFEDKVRQIESRHCEPLA